MAQSLTYSERLDDCSHMQLLCRMECSSLLSSGRQLRLAYYDLQNAPAKCQTRSLSEIREALEHITDETLLDRI